MNTHQLPPIAGVRHIPKPKADDIDITVQDQRASLDLPAGQSPPPIWARARTTTGSRPSL